MSGVGKSTIGKTLARNLGLPFLDLDTLIEKEAGMSISGIFEQEGEVHFRLLEQQTLQKYSASNAVIATGGGTPCFYDNALAMKNAGCCVYLTASVKMVMSRLKQAKSSRPLIAKLETDEALLEYLDKTLLERSEYYERAHLSFAAINFDVKTASDEIFQWNNSNK
jgi:shikimate kinase